MRIRLCITISILAFLFAASTCTIHEPTSTPRPTVTPTFTPIPGEKQEAVVVRVVDGDTIVVRMNGHRYRVRYIGIDTPETHHPTEGAEYLGFEATEANRALVPEGSTVILQRDISDTDVYGRLLRYVWVDDTLVNAELVRMGLARVLFYEPDVMYRREIMAAEAEAKAAKRGLYGPPPTPPAEGPLLYKGTAWTTAPEGHSIPLWRDPARGNPFMTFPVGVQVRVVDAFWVPEAREWWYWVGIRGFNGWTRGEYLTRERPTSVAPGPTLTVEAYDRVRLPARTTMRESPGKSGVVAATLEAGEEVQLKGLSWDEATDRWWYYAESDAAEGWLSEDDIGR